MTEGIRVRVGFVGSSSGSNPYHENFQAIIPAEVQMDFEGMNQEGDAHERLRGTVDAMVDRVQGLVSRNQWQGVVVSGAPRQVMNPDMLERLQAALSIPVATAMSASTAALRALSARRVLLMTPFDESINKGIREYLAAGGVEAVSAPQVVPFYREAIGLKPEEVFDLTKAGLEGSGPVDAVYFQGAVLDPMLVIQRIEEELRTTLVASNPAMLWFMLSTLGFRYQIHGTGRLLEQWPGLV